MRASLRSWIVLAGVACAGYASASPGQSSSGPLQEAAPAASTPGTRAQYVAAAAHHANGDSEQALELIEQGLAIAPKDLKLRNLKAAVLLELRDYAGALAAYRAYLEAAPRGPDRRRARKLIAHLLAAESTFLELTVSNAPAEVYLDSVALGVFCRAEPTCRRAVLPGAYQVTIERSGFERWTGQIKIERGRTAPLAVTLAERPSRLTVRAPQGASVRVDGAAYDAARPISAGAHRLVVSLAGHADEVRELVAREGQPIELDVVLSPAAPARVAVVTPQPPAPRPPPPSSPRSSPGPLTGRRKLALVAGGLGVAAIGAGVVLGLQARRHEGDAYALCASLVIPCHDAPEANHLFERGRALAFQANVAYGVAGGAAIAAAVLWLTGAPEARVAVTPRLDGAAAGLDLAVRF